MRRLLGLALLLILMGAVTPAALADPLVPDRPTASTDYGGDPPLYDQPDYPFWHYTFEGVQSESTGYVQIYFWMNQLMVTKAWSLKMGLRAVEYALSEGFLEPFVDAAGAAVAGLGDLLWSANGAPLVAGALALTGLWAVILWLRGRTTRSWGALGGTALILVILTMLLSSGIPAARTLTGLARSMSAEIHQAFDRSTRVWRDDWELVGRSGNAAWRSLVFEPWLTGQLSQAGQEFYESPEGLRGGRFLAMNLEQRREECFFNTENRRLYCPWWETTHLPRRMLIAGWTTLATLIYAGSLTALAGSIILAQVLVLFLLVLAPVWLLVALWWPSVGLRLTERLLYRLVGALITQAVLTATLSVLLIFTEVGLAAFTNAGWMFQSVLLAALGGMAFRYRYAWTAPLAAATQRWERMRREQAAASAEAARRPARSAAGESWRADSRNGSYEPVPVFAGMAPPSQWWQDAAPAGGAPESLRSDLPRPEEVSPQRWREPAAPVEQYRSQMAQVRERLTQRPAEAPGLESGRPPAGARPEEATSPAAAARQERVRPLPGNDPGQIPPQRPKA